MPANAPTELEMGRLGVANDELRYYVVDASESQLRRWKGRAQGAIGRLRACDLATCTFHVNPERARRYKLF